MIHAEVDEKFDDSRRLGESLGCNEKERGEPGDR